MSSIIDKLQSTIYRGMLWLDTMQDTPGVFHNCERELAAYYKSLMACAVTGRIDSGSRILATLKGTFRSDDGELRFGEEKTSIVRMQANLANYMDGWIAIGAWLVRDYSFGEEITRRLISQQNTVHGGVLTGPVKWAGRERYDLSTAASVGRAFLFTGQRREAILAANFIVSALAHQARPDRWLDLCFDNQWRPMEPIDLLEATYYRFDLSKRGEKVWFPAFCCAFLCETYQLTGHDEYLDAAKKYFRFISASPEFIAGSIANGKSGWAAGLLTLLTGQEEYLKALKIITRNVLARQTATGEFLESPNAVKVPEVDSNLAPAPETPAETGRRIERTAEFTIWSAEFLRLSASGLAIE